MGKALLGMAQWIGTAGPGQLPDDDDHFGRLLICEVSQFPWLWMEDSAVSIALNCAVIVALRCCRRSGQASIWLWMSLAVESSPLAMATIDPDTESLATSASTERRAARPSLSIVSSGVLATLSSPTPVRPPAICWARAGLDDSAAENLDASKVMVPSLVSWTPMLAGDTEPVGLSAVTGTVRASQTFDRIWSDSWMSEKLPFSDAVLPSLESVLSLTALMALLAASIIDETADVMEPVSVPTLIVVETPVWPTVNVVPSMTPVKVFVADFAVIGVVPEEPSPMVICASWPLLTTLYALAAWVSEVIWKILASPVEPVVTCSR